VLVLALMLAGALAEVAALGAVLPFLALIADPGRAEAFPLLQRLFAAFGWRDPGDILLPAALLFAAMALGAGAVRLALAWASQKFVYRLGHDLGTEIYRRILHQPYAYHVTKNTSELIAAINKVQIVSWGVLTQLMQAATGAVIAAFIVLALIVIDPAIALSAAAGFGLVYAGVSRMTRSRLAANGRIIAAAQGGRIRVVQEGLGGIRDVLLDRAQRVYVEKFRRTDLAFQDAQTVNAFIGAAPRFVIEACGMVLIAGLALVLGKAPGGLAAALPVLGALALGAQRLLPLMQQVYLGWAQIAGNRQVLADVLDLLDLPVRSLPPQAAMEPLPFRREIALERLGFRYAPDLPQVLEGIDLRIQRGARVAIVGRTGSGKSTVMDLVMGLLEPTEGAIRIDDTPLGPDNLRAWQAQIAHVPQAIYLSDASVAENIAFGQAPEAIDAGRVREAAQQAELAEFIESLPAGYDTVVGERGVRLSGGQRQRIGIARALYRRASVLVLDEATSALDGATEAAVMASIRGLDRDLTILIVAHRLSTIGFCDRVLRLEGGRVAEDRPALAVGG
jgi:ATP-binding cassette, subfamily B, bacterial PglK